MPLSTVIYTAARNDAKAAGAGGCRRKKWYGLAVPVFLLTLDDKLYACSLIIPTEQHADHQIVPEGERAGTLVICLSTEAILFLSLLQQIHVVYCGA